MVKPKTINLNSVRLNTVALNHYVNISGGGSKLDPIAAWVKNHMAFRYDTSKPMDVYHTNFTKWTKGPIGNTIGTQTGNEIILNGRRNEGDTTLGYTTSYKSLFLTKGDSIKVEGATNEAKFKIIVKGNDDKIVSAFNGIDEIVSDGIYEFDLSSNDYKGITIEITGVTTYSNLRIILLPSGTSLPTNEILKISEYIQDLSGNNRPMLLNNFLFNMMSGMDGYKNESFENADGEIDIRFGRISNRQIKGKPSQDWSKFGYYRVANMKNRIIYCNWHVEGILSGNKVYFAQYTKYDNRVELHNGDNYIELDTNNGKGGYNYISVISDQPYSTDITITQIPEYPGALVTDGVDDYGVVQNMAHGVKMLFMTVNPIGNYNLNKMYYAQRNINNANNPFSVYSTDVNIAYNYRNAGGETYINGTINESIKCNELFGRKHIITIKNDTVSSNNSITPIYFSGEEDNNYFSKLAFYNSIGFDSIPTEEDGFTEQELIDYVIEKYELNKI